MVPGASWSSICIKLANLSFEEVNLVEFMPFLPDGISFKKKKELMLNKSHTFKIQGKGRKNTIHNTNLII